MKSHRLLLLALAAVLCLATALHGDEPVIKHRFICVDNGNNLLIYVDQMNPAASWTMAIPAGSRDIQLLAEPGKPPAKILVSHGNGAAEYDLSTGKRLPWAVDRYKEIQSAVRLDNGQTLLCRVDGTVIRLDAVGKEIAQIRAPEKMNVRLMRPAENGNLVISGAAPAAIFEITPAGQLARRVPLPGKGYKATSLPDGNYMTSTGNECKVVRIDPAGKILSFVGGKAEHPSLGLDFCSGWDTLPNGNILMANWLGHGKQGTGVHLAEFTRDNKLVWQWQDHKLAKQVTNVKVVE